jgi:hypothetical protein
MHIMSPKLYIITPTHAQVTNNIISVEGIRYNPTCFGALRIPSSGEERKNTQQQDTRWLDAALVDSQCFHVFTHDDGGSEH